MKSLLLKIQNVNNGKLPFEYNYSLGIAIYKKLRFYQSEVRVLHKKDQQDIHTISNIIPENPKFLDNGIEFNRGFFIIRSVYDDLLDSLRLSLSLEPTIEIEKSQFKVTEIKETSPPKLNGDHVQFKSLSPVLVRDRVDRKLFRTHTDDVPPNLAFSMSFNYIRFTKKTTNAPNITLTEIKRKTVRVSKDGTVLGAVVLKGSIEADPDLISFSYYKGLGSKTALGLGCWEVI